MHIHRNFLNFLKSQIKCSLCLSSYNLVALLDNNYYNFKNFFKENIVRGCMCSPEERETFPNEVLSSHNPSHTFPSHQDLGHAHTCVLHVSQATRLGFEPCQPHGIWLPMHKV